MGSRGKPEPDGGGGGASTGEYPISPLLERSTIDADGHLEISVSVAGTGQLEENDLDVFLKQPRLSPGERIELGIFVSGLEGVDETELSVFYDGERDELIDLEDPGTVRRSGGETVPASTAASLSTSTATSTSTSADGDDTDGAEPDGAAADADAEPFVHPTTLRHDEPGDGEYALERKPLEGTGTDTGGPAYILEINTRAAAPPGAYPLPIVFTYRSEDGIKQVKKVRTVRVRSWRERWLPWLVGLVVVGLLAAVAIRFGVL